MVETARREVPGVHYNTKSDCSSLRTRSAIGDARVRCYGGIFNESRPRARRQRQNVGITKISIPGFT